MNVNMMSSQKKPEAATTQVSRLLHRTCNEGQDHEQGLDDGDRQHIMTLSPTA